MRSTAAVVAGALLVGAASAQQGVVSWEIAKRDLPKSRIRRRDGQVGPTFQEDINNDKAQAGYFATVNVGTPGQPLTLQLDTGSSDTWVPYTKAKTCTNSRTERQCQPLCSANSCSLGTFDPNQSSSFKDVGQGLFKIEYVDQSGSSGDYFTDVLEIAGTKVENLTMGLGLETDISYGLVGVGYVLNEAIVSSTRTAARAYPNLPQAMVNDGLINTNAFSLWLNDLGASTGHILFGGIDTEKYVGNLIRMSMYKDPRTNAFTSFNVKMTSLSAHSSTGNDELAADYPLNVILDSGTTLTYLPDDLAQQVWAEAGAIYVAGQQQSLAYVPCSFSNSKAYFSFGFAGPGGPRVNVSMDELVVQDTGTTFSSGKYKDRRACLFGIQNSTDPTYLLGDTFLRSAYVVYDLVNNEVGMAATDFNETKSNIVPFPSKGAQIPSATLAPNQAQVTGGSVQRPKPLDNYTAAAGFPVEGAAAGLAVGGGAMALTAVVMIASLLSSGLLAV